ncbi:MAG: MerR family transcriptional regulator [Oscillospiraceae bacterium]
MYRIGVFSKISKTTIKTLRYYDEIGLLKPAHIDGENGYRYYTTDQLVNLHKIVSLRQIGLCVDEVILIMSGRNIDIILEQRKIEIEAQLMDTKEQLFRLNHYILEMKEGFKMDYNAVIKQTPECIVYSKRFIAPSYNSYFEMIPAIGEEVKAINPNLKCAAHDYCFIEYHDGEYKESNIDVELQEAVESFGVETETIKFKKLPSITVVSVLHKGGYSSLKNVYAFTFKWIEENEYTLCGNPRESYIDGIWNKEKEEDWLTELQIPVVRK